jgi:hypothetical protein
MFRLEPNAEFRCRQISRPDPQNRGMTFIARAYFLAPGTAPEVELSPGFGEAIAAGQHDRPQPMGRALDRYWWIYEDRVYSTPDRLSRAAVLRLAKREASERSPRVYRTTPEPAPAPQRGPASGLLV